MIRDICLIAFLSTLGYVLINAQGACNYNGQLFGDGQSWYVNCTTLCKCTIRAADHITCRNPCMDFTTLPNGCYLTAPPSGRCCPQPTCLPNVHVSFQIPPEYSNEYPNIVG